MIRSHWKRATLGRKLLLVNALLLSGLTGLGAVLVWGIVTLRDAANIAADEYAELRFVEEALYHASMAESALDPESFDPSKAHDGIVNALAQLEQFQQFQSFEDAAEVEHQQNEMRHLVRAQQALASLRLSLAEKSNNSPNQEAESRAQRDQIEHAIHDLSRLASQTDIAAVSAATSGNTVTILLVIGSLSGLLICGAVLATIICYWSVLIPVRRLHAGVRRIASGQFTERLEVPSTLEFAELAADFNRMSAELQNFYQQLERKVQLASRELVRSERLASVGFLAAGVAHEINNPLHIMSGHAELALRELHNAARNGQANTQPLTDALEIIRDEAFRCKGITEQLLSLAKLSDGTRTETSLIPLANEVAAMLHGIPKYKDKRLVVDCEPNAGAPIAANPAELKQVILNLAINALEAVEPKVGSVTIHAASRNGSVELAVSDNGCGMTPEVVERSFEPFFSARGNKATRGIGLGLSISHAIVQSHGGSLSASSDGPGKGSCFTVVLPVASGARDAC